MCILYVYNMNKKCVGDTRVGQKQLPVDNNDPTRVKRQIEKSIP